MSGVAAGLVRGDMRMSPIKPGPGSVAPTEPVLVTAVIGTNQAAPAQAPPACRCPCRPARLSRTQLVPAGAPFVPAKTHLSSLEPTHLSPLEPTCPRWNVLVPASVRLVFAIPGHKPRILSKLPMIIDLAGTGWFQRGQDGSSGDK